MLIIHTKRMKPDKLLNQFLSLLLTLRIWSSSVFGLSLNQKGIVWRCYGCTSDDKNCEDDVYSTYDQPPEDCASSLAIGCVTWVIHYEYLFKPILTRGCFYASEAYCLSQNTKRFSLDLIRDKKLHTSLEPLPYQQYIDCMKEKRTAPEFAPARGSNEIPVPRTVKKAPFEKGLVSFIAHAENAKNTESLSDFKVIYKRNRHEAYRRWTYLVRPPTQPVTCYTCSDDVTSEAFGRIRAGPWNGQVVSQPFPSCENETKIKCKGAYGCATLWQLKKNSGTQVRPTVWRGCWYPGDQLCLRRPVSIYGEYDGGRSLSAGSAEERVQGQNCANAYARATESKNNVLQWHGVRVLETEDLYDEFQDCFQSIRYNLTVNGTEADYEPPTSSATKYVDFKDEKDDPFFVAIRYIYCGPKGECNVDENEWWKRIEIVANGNGSANDSDVIFPDCNLRKRTNGQGCSKIGESYPIILSLTILPFVITQSRN